ncbi:MAG TPA: hypothetical protein VIK26_05815, partial [Clostridium sp.]
MKSSLEQLRNRGYVSLEDTQKYDSFSKSNLIALIESKEAYIRTLGVNLLSNKFELDNDMVNLFCTMLSHEKKLYTKIELCNALSKASVTSAKIMLNYLGIIGNNQYKELPKKIFNKKSYPLPRDIVARTLAHMNIEVLPELVSVLKTNNIIAIREAIDSIGFICFYNPSTFNQGVLDNLILCFNQYNEDDIVRWK